MGTVICIMIYNNLEEEGQVLNEGRWEEGGKNGRRNTGKEVWEGKS